MTTMILTILLSLLIVGSQSLYTSSSPVVQLTAKDFDKVYKGVWLVQFYAPWCGHCKQLAPEYQKAAKALKGMAKIAAINADSEKTNVQIQGFPTIKFFVDGKMQEYNGQRNAKGIIEFVLAEYKKIAFNRIGQKATGGSSSGGGAGSSGDSNEKDVIVLEQSNFDEEVLKDNGPWFVEFYAPWCGHCQKLAPEWAALATTLKGQVKVAKIDATQNSQLARRFGVQGYPTIKFFPAGPKEDSSAIDYDGPRSESGMAEWALQKTGGSAHFQHTQITQQSVYDEFCKERNLCVIAFLPHKLDSSPEERQKYLDVIKEVGLKFKGKPFKFLWAQGGDHFEVQEKLGTLGIGYPSLVTISHSKGLFGKLKRSFNSENISEYINSILGNKSKFSKLVNLPEFRKVESTSNFAAGEEEAAGCGTDSCTAPHQEPEEL